MDINTEVLDYKRFLPRGATEDYLAEVDESVKEIDGHRPLLAHIVEKLQKEILYDRIHASAVIEGNRLSRRETIVVLSSGIVEAGSRKDQQEVINLADCCLYLQECLDEKCDLSVQLVKELHQKLLKDIDPQNAGAFRNTDVAITGAKVSPPNFMDVPHLMQEIVSMTNTLEGHPIHQAAWLHWAVARVHPFVDGNGRIARLLQDFVLLKNRYVPATVQPEDRERNYYEALEEADLGDGTAFLEIVAKNTLRTAERYLAIIREERSKTEWIRNIAKAASEKSKQTEHRQFLLLQRAYDSIKYEFANICKDLGEQLSTGVRVDFRDYGSLDFDKYQALKAKGKASRTWLFGVAFNFGEATQRFIFWHGIHYKAADDIVTFDGRTINLLVSMQDSAGNYQKLDDVEEERITLREILADDRSYLRRRYNPVKKSYQWDSHVSPTEIAQHFIQEVLAKVGLI